MIGALVAQRSSGVDVLSQQIAALSDRRVSSSFLVLPFGQILFIEHKH
jgi:hypothetical protein